MSDYTFASPRIAVEYSYDAIYERFYKEGVTDGLPIVPPTREKVEEFLRHTSRPADQVIGVLLPEKREATPWNIAAMSKGIYSGRHPAITPLTAIFHGVAIRFAIGNTAISLSAGKSVQQSISSTAFVVGGTIGRPSVHLLL